MSAPPTSRGTLVIDVEKCKGCELCIAACPPQVLVMSSDVNETGYRYPELTPGCTGCTACQMVCPDFVFSVYQLTPHPDRPRQASGARAGQGSGTSGQRVPE